MFDSIISKVRNAVRAIGATTQRTPWLMPLAILAFFMVW
jgi:hypothetical protein